MGQLNYKFYLNNIEINPPTNWSSLQILATFDNSSVQANISTEEFEFVNEGAQLIKNYLLGGLTIASNGIFEGIPFRIEVSNLSTNYRVFDGYLDFNSYEELSPVRVKCSVKKVNGLNSLEERTQANTFGYLEEIGGITSTDYTSIPYIVEKLDIEGDVAMITVTLFLLAYSIQDTIKDIAKDVGHLTSLLATGLTGALASAIYLAVSILANAVFTAIMIVQAVKLAQKLIELYFPAQRYHKGILLRTVLERMCDYLGYTFVSPIEELDNVYYLPSSPKDGVSIASGIPRASDYGYTFAEMFDLVNRLVNGKIAIVGNELHLRTKGDTYWIKTANYRLPDILDERKKYNNPEFEARTFINFKTDSSDDWTVTDFTGTNYEIIATPIQETDRDKNLMKGLKDVSIPCALGSGKNEFTEFEDNFLALLGQIDKFYGVFGSNSNFAGTVINRKGSLKVSQKVHNTPKLIYLQNGKIPTDQRALFSAKILWEKYYSYDSFVSNNFYGQKRIFEERKIPFGFTDFLKTIDNSYFTTNEGQEGKIESIKWEMDSDFAIVTYWIREIYTKNLTETFIQG